MKVFATGCLWAFHNERHILKEEDIYQKFAQVTVVSKNEIFREAQNVEDNRTL